MADRYVVQEYPNVRYVLRDGIAVGEFWPRDTGGWIVRDLSRLHLYICGRTDQPLTPWMLDLGLERAAIHFPRRLGGEA